MDGNGKAMELYLAVEEEVGAWRLDAGQFLDELSEEPSEVLGQHSSRSHETFKAAKQKAEAETIDCALVALTKSGES